MIVACDDMRRFDRMPKGEYCGLDREDLVTVQLMTVQVHCPSALG